MDSNFISKTLFVVFFTFLGATTHYVPNASSLIQDAIDNALDGDTVLVAQDTYFENLLIEKEIVLKSVDGDTPIINGSSQTLGIEMASTITIRPPHQANSIPEDIEVKGFEIKGGIGNKMDKDVTTPSGTQTISERLGGGIMIYNTSPKIDGNSIKNNGGLGTSGGGGIMSISSDEDWDFNNRDYEINCEPANDSLFFFNNTFENNVSDIANSIYIKGSEEHYGADLTNSTFDIYSTENQGVSQYWVDSQVPVFYNNVSGNCEPIIEGIVYVDPVNGEDIDGCSGHMENPFKTIGAALKWVYPTPSNPITISLSSGIYNNTNEDFPLNIISNLEISGSGIGETVIDAGGDAQVFIINNSNNVTISDMTITGGSGDLGGGLYLEYSNVLLNDLLITDNSAPNGVGSGIFMGYSTSTLSNVSFEDNNIGIGSFFSYGSTPILENVSVYDNEDCGGMILINSNSAMLTNVSIMDNVSIHQGGAIFLKNSLFVEMENILIAGNNSYGGGGAIFVEESQVSINKATIAENNDIDGCALAFLTQEGSNIVNSIIWGGNICTSEFSEISITFSDVNWEGDGNINQNPLFVNPEENDFSLQSNSPCIDAGNPDSPLDPDGTISDMGAYYYDQSPDQIQGDLNGDAIVNIVDIILLVNAILYEDYNQFGDLNSDGNITIVDIILLVNIVLEG